MAVDLSLWVPELCVRLNATNTSDLVFWTEAELYQRISEALDRLAGASNLFCETDDSTAVAATQSLYPLPSAHLAIIMVALDGNVLTPASVAELEALDADWAESAAASTNADVTHWVGDALGTEYLGLYKIPAASGTLLIVLSRAPTALTAKAPSMSLPAPLADYLALGALADARGKEGDARMPEVAQHLQERMKLYDQIIQAYWGGGF